jgi:hypothetical protein
MIGGGALRYGCRGSPNSGAFTGVAAPTSSTSPSPPTN